MSASAAPPVRVVGVFAHPDDDVFSIGGTLAMHASDVEPTLVFCTSGENGPIWVEGIATRESLGAVREREQAAAMEALGVRARSVFLRYRDGGLTDVSREELIGKISDVLRDVRPHVVVTFGVDGLTSHPDHVRAGETTSVAFELLRAEAREAAPQRLLEVALPASAVGRFDRQLAGGAGAGPAGSLLNLASVPDEHIWAAVDTRPVADRKRQAVEAHRTQIGELAMIPEEARWLFFDTEWFVRAWPPRHADGPAVADAFEGLDLRSGRGRE
jgi:LmbE family N-acetylglucosaminyl deacetylase